MNYFLFEDLDTGKKFIIGAMTKAIAYEVAFENFDRPKYICELTEEEAVTSSFDEYWREEE